MSGLSLWPLMQDSRPVFDGLSLHSVMKFHSAIPGTLTEQRTVPATTCTILCSANPSLHSPVSSKMLMMTVSFKKTLNKAYLSLSYVWKKKNGSRSRIFLYKSDFHIFNSKLPIYFACPLWLPKFCGLYLYIFSTDIELPRTLTSDRQGSLPSARVVSNTVLSGSTPTSATHSTFLTHFGQFIDHDVISTPSMRGNLGITNLQVFKFRPFLFPRNPTYVSQMTGCKTAVKFFIVKQFTQYF